MANEFVIKNGYISKGDSIVEGTLTANTISATTISGGTLYGDGSNLTGISSSFTGNTSATCITDLYLTNLYGCSPLNLWNELVIQSAVTLNSLNNVVYVYFDDNGNDEFKVEWFDGTNGSLLKLSASTASIETTDYITSDFSNVNFRPTTTDITFNTNTSFNIDSTASPTSTSFQLRGEGEILLDANYSQSGNTSITLKDNIIEINGLLTQFSGNVNVISGITATTISGGTLFGDGSNLTNIANTFTTAFTYNNNTFSIVDNSGTTFNATINTVTGLTVNGELNTDYIQLDTSYTATTAPGKMWWNQSDGTLNIGMAGGNVTQQVGLEQYYLVSNVSGVTINEGQVVRAAGTDPTNEKLIGDLMIADGTIQPRLTLGIATETITSGNTGYITSFGVNRGIDATGSVYGETWNIGDVLYSSPTVLGGLTNVLPTSPNVIIEVAFVLDNSVNGSLFVRPTIFGRIEDLNDVQTTGATQGDLLVYNSLLSLWEDSKILPGSYNITGTSSASTFNITTTPTTNTTDFDVLVRNAISGNIEQRTFNSLNNIPNVVTVSLSGGTADFTSIKDAIDSISGASLTNPYIVKVGPGVYNENPITMKSFVAILGESSVSTIVNAVDPNQTLFNAVDNTFISDLLIQGCTGTNVSAIVYSSSTSVPSNAIVYVENVRFGANYTHVKNNPFGGGNTAIQCTNIKYGAQPFTLGFYMTSDGTSTGRFQLRNVTTTAGGVANATGLTFAKVDQPNCTIIGNLVTVTKAGSAPVSGIGFQVENGGLLRLNGFNIQRFGTGIYVPQVGSAPTIDAVGLNFENCTTDVDIIHSGATGKVNGTDSFLKTKINIDAPLYEVNQDPREITVAKKGGDFSSIKSAVDYLAASGNTSSNNRFIISVGPGEFTEGEIDLTNTPYVSIVGSNIQTTLIKPSGSTQHIINIGASNEISFLTLSGAGSNYAAIHCDDIGNFAQCHKVSFIDCDTNIWVKSSTQDTILYGEYVDFNGEYAYGVRVNATNGFQAYANIENYYQFPSSTGATIGNYVEGIGGLLNCAVATMDGVLGSGSTAFEVVDGANLNLASVDINSWEYGVRNPNIGTGVTFEVVATIWSDCTNDISVENVSSIGKFQGIASHVKLFTASPNIYWLFLDPDDGELDITRKGSVTFTDGTHTDFTTLLFEGGTMGLLDGGLITEVSGFTINTQTGFGYLESPTTPGVIKRIDWSDTQLVLTSGSTSYIFINENGILSAGGIPNTEDVILLGRVVTDDTGIEFIENSPLLAEHTSNKLSTFARTALGPIYATGSIVSENLSNPFEIDVTTGQYFFAEVEFMPTGGTSIQFIQYYRNGLSGWTTSASTIISNTLYDNNGTLTGLTTSAYTKHTLYVLGDTTDEKYFLVFGQDEYMTLVETEDAPLPTPPTYFSDAVTPIASIYVQESATGITQIQDIRPVIGFRAAGVNASSVHGNLLGLGADDHTQYLLVDGNRAMSGNLNMDNNNIISAGTINGVTIQSHATRHQYNGADEVGTLTPTAFAIPYADASGLLDGWVSTGSTTTLGRVKLSSAPLVASNPIAVGTTDTGYLNSITATTYSSNVLTSTKVNGTTTTATINSFTGLTINGNLTITGLTSANGNLITNTIFDSSVANSIDVNSRALYDTTSIISLDWENRLFNDISNLLSADWQNRKLFDSNSVESINWESKLLKDSANVDTLDYNLRIGYDTSGNNSISYESRELFDNFGNGWLNWASGTIDTFTTIKSVTISATTYQNLPKDVFVTGGTYDNGTGTATFTNNTGGTFNVVGFSTGGGGGGTFTGGTVTGATIFTGGLSANTISATTYQNLPTDIRVTGATYSNNNFTFTNNTGGTFSVLFNTVTGLTVNGNLTVTGTTSSGTISATTYQNLPIKDIKTITITYPTATENVTFFYTQQAYTIAEVEDVVRGTSPSVTYNISFASTRDSGSPTNVFTSNRTVTSTAGSSTTTFANATIPANSWVWIITSAAASGTTEFSLTLIQS